MSVNGAILGYNMIMENEMTVKRITKTTRVFVDNNPPTLEVCMHTSDEDDEVCTIRFGDSFTLSVASPQDLMNLADEIDKFAKQAYELHYPEEFETWGTANEAEAVFIQAGIDARESLQAMESTAEPLIDPYDEYAVEAAEHTIKDEYNPEDPVNW